MTETTQDRYEQLQWPQLLEELARRTHTSAAAELARATRPETVRGRAEHLLDVTEQARRLVAEGSNPPLAAIGSTIENIDAAAKGAALEGRELLECAYFLKSCTSLKNYCNGIRSVAPDLADLAEPITDHSSFANEIIRCFNQGGEMLDSASAKLSSLRNETRNLASSLKKRIDSILKKTEVVDLLQDAYYTIRDDRYVLPVKADFSGRISGIVHGASSSGATLFIEPQELVESNNRLKEAEIEARREELRILSALSGRLGQAAGSIRANITAYSEIDLAFARAILSVDINGVRPEFIDKAAFQIEGARHPLLLLARSKTSDGRKSVIGNDLKTTAGGLIITGPNAGGKTVFMKMLGLFALMSRSGLFPSAEFARLSFFKDVAVDIGDPQSVAEDLSYFSGHIITLKRITERLGRGTLALLDEIAGGTDPSEGAALARALIETLVERGVFVIATTHYHGLKVVPTEDDRFINIAAQFDSETGLPAYRLTPGAPGRSRALEIASSLGLPKETIDRARELLSDGELNLDSAIENLEQERKALENKRDDFAEAERALEASRINLDKQAEQLEAARKDLVEKEQGRFAEQMRAAREKIAEVIGDLCNTGESVRIAGKKLDKIEDGAKEEFSRRQKPPRKAIEFATGDIVWVASLKKEAKVIEPTDERGMIRVQAGAIKMPVHSADCRPVDGRGGGESINTPPTPDAEPEVDLRGMRVDEALIEIDRALDRALLRGLPTLRIIHGHGTGALRRAVREYLPGVPAISGFRKGETAEGGDGVTVAELR